LPLPLCHRSVAADQVEIAESAEALAEAENFFFGDGFRIVH
jgi:hypothetical protein